MRVDGLHFPAFSFMFIVLTLWLASFYFLERTMFRGHGFCDKRFTSIIWTRVKDRINDEVRGSSKDVLLVCRRQHTDDADETCGTGDTDRK